MDIMDSFMKYVKYTNYDKISGLTYLYTSSNDTYGYIVSINDVCKLLRRREEFKRKANGDTFNNCELLKYVTGYSVASIMTDSEMSKIDDIDLLDKIRVCAVDGYYRNRTPTNETLFFIVGVDTMTSSKDTLFRFMLCMRYAHIKKVLLQNGDPEQHF